MTPVLILFVMYENTALSCCFNDPYLYVHLRFFIKKQKIQEICGQNQNKTEQNGLYRPKSSLRVSFIAPVSPCCPPGNVLPGLLPFHGDLPDQLLHAFQARPVSSC